MALLLLRDPTRTLCGRRRAALGEKIPVGSRLFKCESTCIAARGAKTGARANRQGHAARISERSEPHGRVVAAGLCDVPQANANDNKTLQVACGTPFYLASLAVAVWVRFPGVFRLVQFLMLERENPR
ncbi:MAG: hypothetical protein MUF73_15260 [Rhodobacteraceae bacterium]|jgi:hypothetical protein|nr:hypothetical protein [Paracoccaceae bacterium]